MTQTVTIGIKKVDADLQIVYGEVYAPNFPDADGEFMTVVEVQKMAHSFMLSGRLNRIDTQHDNRLNGSAVLESFVAQKGDPTFLENSWVVGVWIPDEALWDQVIKGEINGFSLEALVKSVERVINVTTPDKIVGKTEEDRSEHEHGFEVEISRDGTFLGGRSGITENHWHRIKHTTVTGPAIGADGSGGFAPGHTHRFSIAEQIQSFEVEGETETQPKSPPDTSP